MLVVAELARDDVDDARAEALAREEERVWNEDDGANAFTPSPRRGSSTLVVRI